MKLLLKNFYPSLAFLENQVSTCKPLTNLIAVNNCDTFMKLPLSFAL